MKIIKEKLSADIINVSTLYCTRMATLPDIDSSLNLRVKSSISICPQLTAKQLPAEILKTPQRRIKKTSWPLSRVLSWTVIHLGCPSPDTSSNLPGSSTGRASGSLFGLAPSGVYPATCVTAGAVRSYRTISTLPVPRDLGGIFSVALAIGSHRPGVTWHSTLWSPDFPL